MGQDNCSLGHGLVKGLSLGTTRVLANFVSGRRARIRTLLGTVFSVEEDKVGTHLSTNLGNMRK